jgi:hypothetical protein
MAKGAAAAATSQPRRTNAVSSQNLTIQRTSRGLITITGGQNELAPIIEALMRGNSGGTQTQSNAQAPPNRSAKAAGTGEPSCPGRNEAARASVHEAY